MEKCYASAVVLGINDAIVGLTATLVGLTFALNSTVLIGLSGLIMGIASSFSMAASSFLSHSELDYSEPEKAGVITGISYFFQSLLLVTPYFLLSKKFVALELSVVIALLSIALYNFFISSKKSQPFLNKFLKMLFVSGGVSVFIYLFTEIAKAMLGVEV